MRFGNAAWGFRETPIENQLKITSEMGLGILEIGIANANTKGEIPLDVTEQRLKEILKMSEAYNVEILCAATGNDFTAGIEDVQKIKKVIDICGKLRVKYLRIFTGFMPICDVKNCVFDMMIKSLCEVCDYAEENKVIPVIETHGAVNGYDDGVEHIMSSSTDIVMLEKILKLIPDNAKVCYDPANLYAVGVEEPQKFYEAVKSKVAYAHFKDFAVLESGHLKPSFCGDGNMNWNTILNTMNDFDGFAVFEYENVEDIREGLEKSYNFIKGVSRNE